MNKKNNVTIKGFIVAALVGGSLLSFVGSADATLSLDYTFGFSNPIPSITYNQASGTLSCVIPVTTITGIDTPRNSDSPFLVSGGVLDFVTGKYDAQTGTFAPGGTVTVTGGIPALSVPNSTLLLSGVFNSGASLTETPRPLQNWGGMNDNFEASFTTTGSQSLYNYFYLGNPAVSSASEDISLSFIATIGLIVNNNSNGLIGGNILDTPLSAPNGNSGTPVPTPLPAGFCLLGSGLMSLAGLRSRSKDKLAIV